MDISFKMAATHISFVNRVAAKKRQYALKLPDVTIFQETIRFDRFFVIKKIQQYTLKKIFKWRTRPSYNLFCNKMWEIVSNICIILDQWGKFKIYLVRFQQECFPKKLHWKGSEATNNRGEYCTGAMRLLKELPPTYMPGSNRTWPGSHLCHWFALTRDHVIRALDTRQWRVDSMIRQNDRNVDSALEVDNSFITHLHNITFN